MPGKLQIAGYTNSATGMTGKSDHPARWRTEWIGLKHPTDTNVRGCTLLSFQRPLRLGDGTRRPSRMGQAPGLAQKDE
jgi:hypothetical protein